jgi:ATP-dependent 26S proteasome regulatory subunit
MQVFKVAKVMAPSVIYIDEIEKVMVYSNTIV